MVAKHIEGGLMSRAILLILKNKLGTENAGNKEIIHIIVLENGTNLNQHRAYKLQTYQTAFTTLRNVTGQLQQVIEET